MEPPYCRRTKSLYLELIVHSSVHIVIKVFSLLLLLVFFILKQKKTNEEIRVLAFHM